MDLCKMLLLCSIELKPLRGGTLGLLTDMHSRRMRSNYHAFIQGNGLTRYDKKKMSSKG